MQKYSFIGMKDWHVDLSKMLAAFYLIGERKKGRKKFCFKREKI